MPRIFKYKIKIKIKQWIDSENMRERMLILRSPPQIHRGGVFPSIPRRKNLCSLSSKWDNPCGDPHWQMQIDISRYGRYILLHVSFIERTEDDVFIWVRIALHLFSPYTFFITIVLNNTCIFYRKDRRWCFYMS
jgi:hypothetical protein